MSTHSSSTLSRVPQSMALFIGLMGLAIAGYGVYTGLQAGESRPLFSWLLGFGVWFSIGVGMLMLTMMTYIFGAGWSVIIRRQLEHAVSAFPYLALILSPLLLIAWLHPEHSGLLWEWMDPHSVLPGGHTVGEDVLYHSKAGYLNLPFFTIRIALYFGVFCGLVYLLRRYSFGLDASGCPSFHERAVKIAAGGIPLAALALTFAAFDLFKSISYHWFSTMYGVWFFATSMRAGIAGTLVLCAFMARPGYPLYQLYNERHRYQLGCLTLAFTVFWAYITFCQYFLIYNANIPEETFWFNMRELNPDGSKNSWWYVSMFGMLLSYFILPFFYMLFYNNKIRAQRILFAAAWVLVFHIADLYFNILPHQIPADNALGYVVEPFRITLYDVAAYVGTGGICVWAFLKSLGASQAPAIPLRDPFVRESIYCHQ